MEPALASLGENELDLLKMLWDAGPCTVRRIHAFSHGGGRNWAYNTVLTMLQRLESKGFVVVDRSEVAHVFRAVVSKDRLLRSRLEELAQQFCGGMSTPLVQALVEGQSFTPEEIQHFRKILDEADPKKSKHHRSEK